MNDLIPLTDIDPPSFFRPGGTAQLCAMIESEARRFVPDISTAAGREDIARLAARINRSKTFLDEVGRKYVAEIKALPKAIDAERRAMRQRLDDLKDEVRAPLTAWEDAIRARQARFEERLAVITAQAADLEALPSTAIRARIEAVEHIDIDADWEEYQGIATGAKAGTLATLAQALTTALDREAATLAHEIAIRCAAAAEARAELLTEMAQRGDVAAAPMNTDARLERRAEVHRTLLAELAQIGIEEALARRLIVAIARAQIPHLAIYY